MCLFLLHSKLHYEAKLCILCIVSGIRNRPKSDLLRNPQHCYFSLIFNAVLDSTYSLRNPLTVADSAYILQNPLAVAESRTTSYICLLWNP